MSGRLPVTRPSLVALALAMVSSSRVDAQPTFRSLVELVRVDVLVSDRQGPVVGLTANDFEVRDNGVLQEITTTSAGEVPLNIVLVFDISTSIDADRLDHLRRAGRSVLDGLQAGDRAALVTFSHRVIERRSLTSDVDALRGSLDALDPSGRTALVDGAYAGLAVARSETGRSLVIVFSDGLDTASWLTEEQVLDTAQRAEAVVYGVSVGPLLDRSFLQSLTETSGGRLFPVESTSNLHGLFLAILQEFRHRYLLGYTPQGVKPQGYHRLEVRVKRRGLTVRARPGYDASSGPASPR